MNPLIMSKLNDSLNSNRLLKPNTSINSSIPNLLQQPDSIHEKKKQYLNTKKNSKKAGKKSLNEENEEEFLTPFDFITLLRNDPEMVDEFCYLNKRFEAYNWRIVKFDERNSREYMTISARGITHFIDDEATFLTIEEWEREVTMFQKLKKIKFFKEYKRWKTFALWKHLMRRNMMKKTSQHLSQELFILDINLREPLLKIRRICIDEISQWELVETLFPDPKAPYDFLNSQETFRSSKLAMLETTETLIKTTISKSCKLSLDAFKKENRIQNKNEFGETDEAPPLLVGDESNKEMPYTQEATIRTHYKKLRKYVKLIDYMMIEAKMNMVQYSITKLNQTIGSFNHGYLDILSNPNGARRLSRNNPILIIEAEFEGLEVSFKPSQEQTKNLFEDSIYKSVQLVCKRHKQYLHDSEFQVYTKSNDYTDDPTEDLIEMDALVESNDKFKQQIVVLRKELDISFGFLMKISENIRPLLKIYHDDTNLDMKTFETKEVEELREALSIFKVQDEQLHNLDPRSDVGIYVLEKTILKNKIINCANSCLQNLCKLMPELNYIRALKLLEIVTILNFKLANQPGNVDDFVTFQESVNEALGKKEDIDNRYNEIFYTSQLMEQTKIKVVDQQKSKCFDALNQVKTLEKRLKAADEALNSNMNRFRKELERLIKSIDPKVNELANKLTDQQLSDTTANVDIVVDFISELGGELDDLVKKAEKYNRYQFALQVDVTQFNILEELKRNFVIYSK